MIGKDLGHRGPVQALLFLFSACIARLISRLIFVLLLLVLGVHHVLAQVAVFALLVELFEGGSEQLSIQSELVLVNFLLFAASLTFGSAVKCGFVARLLGVSEGSRLRLWVVATFLLLLLLLFLHTLAFFLERLLMLLLELVEHVDQELDVVHVLDAERLSHGVNLDLELLFGIDSLAALQSLVIDEVWCLNDQEAEHLLHALILFAGRILIPGSNTLVVDELALRLGLSVVPAL